MNLAARIFRHARLSWVGRFGGGTPPLLVLFINSTCNQKCEHCFYWRSLNSKDDLTRDELFELSRSLGRIENLNLSGGEPFLRAEFSEICRQFIRHNGVRQIYVPTNGYFTERTLRHVSDTLEERSLELLVAELSLDGLAEFHNRFRDSAGAFERAMETYDALAELQRRDPRIRIHAISTATAVNMGEIRRLTTYLHDRCPQMDHHNLALIRGERKNPSLAGPDLERYRELYGYVQRLWAPREAGRYGAIVEPMLQQRKMRTAAKQAQVVPCRAGKIAGVVYANGDVSVCETHQPLGNLRKKTFGQIWWSEEARRLRTSIGRGDCWCTNEVFLWPSIIYSPIEMVKAVFAARAWKRPRPLAEDERVSQSDHAEEGVEQLISIQTDGKRT